MFRDMVAEARVNIEIAISMSRDIPASGNFLVQIYIYVFEHTCRSLYTYMYIYALKSARKCTYACAAEMNLNFPPLADMQILVSLCVGASLQEPIPEH